MTLIEYEKKHKSTHYNLCWLNSEEKPVSYLSYVANYLIVSNK